MRLAALWAAALTALLLWPALGVGYVLSYDMVWVPDLQVGRDALGLGSALPRAVPSDAVVGVLDEVVPGMLLQKVVLAGALVGGAIGAARLVEHLKFAPRLVAVTFWIWNPFVVERLVMGHWPVLVGYAVLPWLAVHAARSASSGSTWRRSIAALLLLLPLGSLSPSAGLVSAVVVLAFGASRAWGRNLALAGLVGIANAPWIVAGLAHRESATSSAVGAEIFALSGEGGLPAPLAALGLGGIWNSEVVPASRESVLAWVALGVLLALAALGARGWWRARSSRSRVAYLVTWGVGFGLATATWAVPDLVGQLAESVPGLGLVRDGSRMLGMCALLTTVLVAHGVDRLLPIGLGRVPRAVLAAGLVLHPIAVLPDAALGVSGRLEATSYPQEYVALRAAVGDADGADVLMLPFNAFRAPTWNAGRTVLDPLPRYLAPDAVTNDELVVAGVTIAGEDPRAREVGVALRAPTATERSRRLAELGIGMVIIDREAPGPVPQLAGTGVFEGPRTAAVELTDPVSYTRSRLQTGATLAAWIGFVSMLGGGILAALADVVNRRARRWYAHGRTLREGEAL